MMEEKQLKKLFPFRLLGVFSVVREKPREAVKSLNYAAGLLREKSSSTMWIFPQGEILPNDLRPLNFYNGISRLTEKLENCLTVPLAFRYEFLGEFKPEIFVKIGKCELVNSSQKKQTKFLTENFENKLTQTLDELKKDIICMRFDDYKRII
jgi:hypothetical protein